jgi:DNA polymerase-3 subunit delta'
MAKLAPLPWHNEIWRRLEEYVRQKRLPGALLVSGPSGIGKRQLVRCLAHLLLCAEQSACGECFACKLFLAETHPDWVNIAPLPGKELTVDQIRALIELLALKPQYGSGRVVVVEASQLNLAAANSFLKTLEEPTPGTVIVLLSELPSRLPATILSRCQHLKLTPPPVEVAIAWLKGQGFSEEIAELALAQSAGAPLAAQAWLKSDVPLKRGKFLKTWVELLKGRRDPVVLAQDWQEEPLELILTWLLTLVADLVRLNLGVKKPLANPDQPRMLQDQAKGLNLTRLFEFWQCLLEARQALTTQLNRGLLLENVFLQAAALRHDPSH